ncbi:MAG: T9SS type A sorting domain-containing protein [Aureispira sp.]|nr:T9SS type A sorting domain-containing protein [Aureispira sp.]
MHKIIYTLFTILTFSIAAQAQTFDWARHITTLGDAEIAWIKDITADASGNVYAIGQFETDIDIDGDGSTDLTNSSATNDDILLLKYNSTGTLIWSVHIVTSGASNGDGITVDPAGNVYITGAFRGANVNFDPLGGSVPTLSSSASDDIFVAKYDTDGNCQWVFPITNGTGSTSNDAYDLATDGTSLYVAGRFAGSGVDFDPDVGTNTKNSAGGSDVFLAKYDVDGNHEWVVTAGHTSSDYSRDVAIDGNGDVYWVGRFDANGTNVNFDPIGGSGSTLTTTTSSADAFLVKYNTNGEYQWGHTFGEPGTTNTDYAYGVATDAANNVYITGLTEGDTNFDPIGSALFNPATGNNEDMYLASYNSAGEFRWLSKIGNASQNIEYGYEVSVSSSYVYVAGRVRGTTIDIYDATNINTAIATLTPATGATAYSAFLGKFDLNGNYQNAFTATGSNDEEALAIHAANNKVYWAGFIESANVDFDPGVGSTLLNNLATNVDDGFIAQYDDTPLATVEDIAITEWIGNPSGDESLLGNRVEFVELYNFGASTVNLKDWRIQDEDSNDNVISTTDLFLAAGEYLIITRNKSNFEANWFNGCANSQVIQVAGLRLANGSDEIIITDGSNTVWSVAYSNDETEGRATHYTEVTYTNRIFGSKATPGIVRNGNDVTGSLGYQKNNSTTDANSRTAVNGDIGSPLNRDLETVDIVRDNSLDFNGTTDYVNLGDNIEGLSNVTFEGWVYYRGTASSTYHEICSKAFVNSLNIWNGGGDKLWFHLGTGTTWFDGGSITSNASIPTNEWTHIAVTWDQATTTVNMYINGVLDKTALHTHSGGSIMGSNTSLRGLGSYSPAGTQLYNGQLDEFRIWNTTRTATEVRENMHLNLQGCEASLAAYYQMNEGSGTSLADKSNNGYTGTLTSVQTWPTSGVNTGQDASGNSNSQSIVTLAGASIQNFTNANLDIEFKEHSIAEEITVTYQNFAPNTTTGLNSTIMPTDIQWTITYSELNPVTRLMDLTFTYPANTFTSLEVKKYDLYRRDHNSEGDWIRLGAASDITSNTITFRNIDKLGQFMVQARSTDLVSDVRGNMYFFNNSLPQYINIPSSASLSFDRTDPITIETWAKPNPNGTVMTLFEKMDGTGRGYSFYIQANRLVFQLANTAPANDFAIFSDASVIDNQWQHIAMTYDGSSDASGVQFYIDGVLLGSFIGRNALTATTVSAADAKIAAKNNATFGFDGYLEELRVWNASRSEDELRSTMHLTLKGNESDLVAYYQFNRDTWDGSNYTVVDAMGTNNGTSANIFETSSYASEVAVAGGNSQKLIVPAVGPFIANYDKIPASISFGTGMAPDGDVWVSRLETEKPNGWSTVTGDVDNEYFVVRNFGNNQTFAPLNNIQFSNIAYIDAIDAAQPEPTSPLQVHKRSSIDYGATWGSSLANANAATAGTSGSVTFDNSASITSFSQFVVVNAAQNSDLPVELVEFTATRKDNDEVVLNWSTASELNNKGFEIQRMLETETEFTVVGWVDGMGTSMDVINYQFIDDNAFDGTSYYRLRQVDFDGTAELTEMRVVEGMTSSQFAHTEIYPNPVKNELNLRFTQIKKKQTANIQIFDARGQRIYSQIITPNPQQTHIINEVENFAAGIYLLSIELDGEKFVQKFVKQ